MLGNRRVDVEKQFELRPSCDSHDHSPLAER